MTLSQETQTNELADLWKHCLIKISEKALIFRGQECRLVTLECISKEVFQSLTEKTMNGYESDGIGFMGDSLMFHSSAG